MADNEGWGQPQTGGRTPSPSRNRRSRSPERNGNANGGRDMDTEESGRGRPSNAGASSNVGNNLHVSGLASRVEERDLEEAFSKYGRLTKVQVMRDPHTRDPRGFAFVTFEAPEDAGEAMRSLNATEIAGKRISIEMARRGRARTPTPGAYHGPPKRDVPSYGGGGGRDRYRDDYRDDYDRGGRGGDRYDDRRGGYDDRRGGGGYDRGGRDYDRYDDRRGGGGYDRGGRDYDRSSYAAPMRGGDDRRGGGGGYDDRSYDRRDDFDRRRY